MVGLLLSEGLGTDPVSQGQVADTAGLRSQASASLTPPPFCLPVAMLQGGEGLFPIL